MEGLAAARPDDAPGLLVRGRGRKPDQLQHLREGACLLGRQRPPRLLGEEELVPPPAGLRAGNEANEPVAHRALAGRVADRRDRGHPLAGARAQLAGEGAVGERASEPAGAQPQVGRKQDERLEREAVVLESSVPLTCRARQEVARALDEAVGPEGPQRLGSELRQLDQLKPQPGAEGRRGRHRVHLLAKPLLLGLLDGTGQIGAPGGSRADQLGNRSVRLHGITSCAPAGFARATAGVNGFESRRSTVGRGAWRCARRQFEHGRYQARSARLGAGGRLGSTGPTS